MTPRVRVSRTSLALPCSVTPYSHTYDMAAFEVFIDGRI